MTTLRISQFDKENGKCLSTKTYPFDTTEDAIEFLHELYSDLCTSVISFQFTITELNEIGDDYDYDL